MVKGTPGSLINLTSVTQVTDRLVSLTGQRGLASVHGKCQSTFSRSRHKSDPFVSPCSWCSPTAFSWKMTRWWWSPGLERCSSPPNPSTCASWEDPESSAAEFYHSWWSGRETRVSVADFTQTWFWFCLWRTQTVSHWKKRNLRIFYQFFITYQKYWLFGLMCFL